VTSLSPRITVAAEALDHALTRATGSRALPGNRVGLLIDGPATYAAMERQITAAERRIHLENYIIRDDSVGRFFAELLIQRARAGVVVRVLYDWLGSIGTTGRYWQALRNGGVEVQPFSPPSIRDPLLIVARDHRKLLVVDGERAVAGGLCIGDEWMGDPERSRLPWRDTALEVRGPAARLLDRAFERAWLFAGGELPGGHSELASDVASAGPTAVRIVATEPGRERAYRTVDLLIGIARARLWISEAYLVTPQRMYQALKDAARDGVDVRLLLPGTSDLRVVRNVTRVGYRSLLRAGVRIWEWQGPMLHAKTIVADGHWTNVGSSNLNASSLLANWELDVLVDDDGLAQAMERQYLIDLSQSSEVLLQQRRIPSLFGRQVPAALAKRTPRQPRAAVHVRTFRERRRRAILMVGRLVYGARAAVFGPLALALFVSGVLYALFPTAMALASAIVAVAAAAALAVRAGGHRVRG
jgi:cardiolipin synthase A/B